MSAAAHHGSDYHYAHHFDSLGQQQSTVRFGMWLFLVTEVLFFGGIMSAYTVYRTMYPDDFEAGSAALNPLAAILNSFLLLTSSLTITLGVRAAFDGDIAGLRKWLMATILLGTAFLGLKANEYYTDVKEGLVPTKAEDVIEVAKSVTVNGHDTIVYDKVRSSVFARKLEHVLKENEHEQLFEKCNPYRVQLFFLFYYCMTGLHVLHMVIGLGLLVWQYILAGNGFFNFKERYVYVEAMSLYWHFVDMVWMFLLPLLYLAGPHSFDHLSL
ncbi:MAG TPA: cytochrome c oxidase subunit 3 [Fimbriiglobus sp.]